MPITLPYVFCQYGRTGSRRALWVFVAAIDACQYTAWTWTVIAPEPVNQRWIWALMPRAQQMPVIDHQRRELTCWTPRENPLLSGEI